MRKGFVFLLVLALVLVGIGGTGAAPSRAQSTWSLAEAAKPYAGTEIRAFFLERPGYVAAQQMIPEFEQITGIRVTWDVTPYENSLEKQTLDFTGGTAQFDVVLVDVVWIGNFAANGWIVPLEKFYNDPALADPELNLDGFFPILLESFGTWDGVIYGLPFDNYSGLLYYNKCMLAEAGFDNPPDTWEELLNTYGPALTKDGKYAFALQSRRGETQSADSFMRVIWPFGGSLLKDDFTSNLSSPESLAGLKFRQELMRYMPPDIVAFDHDETVQALAQGQVAMITEWSAFYATLANPATSRITDCLGITVEPAGPAGRRPALGGFSLAINSSSSEAKQAAAWLFIQWITSEAKAKEYAERGGVSGRRSVYSDPEMIAKFPHYPALAESWEKYGNPVFRPRFPEWPAISDVIAQFGTEMMLGSISVEEGVARIEAQMATILRDYTEGRLPKLQ
ncbi:MAG: sugar ABC transporter substrate-binding protein [Aggregatilineales bacterium]